MLFDISSFIIDRKDESPKLRWKKDQTYWKKNSDNSGNEDIQLEGNLSAEYSMTTLDTLELLVQVTFNGDSAVLSERLSVRKQLLSALRKQ